MKAHGFARIAALGLALATSGMLGGCANAGGASALRDAPATSGTHTVLGRGFFTGNVMLLMDAHTQEGRGWGTMEYSRVEGGGTNALRVMANVTCLGVFRDGMEAVVAGPVTRTYGDYSASVDRRDWWVVELREGGEEGDLLRAGPHPQDRALTLCHSGPEFAPNLRAVDGDLSIH